VCANCNSRDLSCTHRIHRARLPPRNGKALFGPSSTTARTPMTTSQMSLRSGSRPRSILQERLHSKRSVSFRSPSAYLRVWARSPFYVQFLRTLRRLLRWLAERVSRGSQLSPDGEILSLFFRDLGPIQIAAAQWKFIGRASELASKLLVQSLFDIHEPFSDGYIQHASGQRQSSPALQLPSRQRSLHHLQRRNAICQHCPANPPQVRETRFAVKWSYSFAP